MNKEEQFSGFPEKEGDIILIPDEKETTDQANPSENTTPLSTDQATTTEEMPKPEKARSSYSRGTHPDELPLGYFVVEGVYSHKTNAQKAIREFARQGYQAATGYNSQTKYYYVYVNYSDDIDKCRQVRNQYRQKALFKEAWLLKIKE